MLKPRHALFCTLTALTVSCSPAPVKNLFKATAGNMATISVAIASFRENIHNGPYILTVDKVTDRLLELCKEDENCMDIEEINNQKENDQ